ncbi:S-crystallin SL11-like [Saccoglossus kowalevskii]|uniref:glutathione transferase n=1 Tax=Saccoglossus kowalevskii TaxID=10224 RepID=A0ABM0GJX8_SACKO|nr:PREDICTED: S-crystallin SL11-like [Saccoglossus kowalevskii]
MPNYKLHYFDIRGRAEPCRLILAAAEVDYEDIRIPIKNWPEEKASGKYPLGQLPCMEVNGVMLAQSRAIARFLANEHGLAGKTSLDKARADIVVDTLGDLSPHMVKMVKEKDATKKAELEKEYASTTLQACYKNLEKLLISNNGGDGFFVGDELTWADLVFMNTTEIPITGHASLDEFPKLKALYERVKAQPKIADWIAKRPETYN